MILPVLALLLVLAVGGVGFAALRGRTRREAEKQAVLEHPRTETLEYVPAPGQDPAVLMAALKKDGYAAVYEPLDARPRVIVDCPAGRDRERARLRALIRHTNTTGFEGIEMEPGGVTFEDERV